MTTTRTSRLLTLRVLAWRSRRAMAVLVVAALALAVVRTLAPPPAPTVGVVVLARDVAAGTTLDAADLRLRAVPRCCVPGAPLDDPTALVGRTLLVSAPAGLPVVDGLLAGERFDVDPPPGTVVVPVRLGGATAPLLRPGDRVDLVPGAGTWDDAVGDGDACAPEDGDACHDPDGVAPPVLARGALVLEVPEPATGGTLGLGSPEGEPSAVVAVTPDEGRVLASASATAALGAVLVG